MVLVGGGDFAAVWGAAGFCGWWFRVFGGFDGFSCVFIVISWRLVCGICGCGLVLHVLLGAAAWVW